MVYRDVWRFVICEAGALVHYSMSYRCSKSSNTYHTYPSPTWEKKKYWMSGMIGQGNEGQCFII